MIVDVRKKGLAAHATLLLCVLTTFAAAPSLAQDDDAPPPSRTVTKEDRDRLAQQTDVKNHMKLALELMNTHLTAAEHYDSQSNFESAYSELGGFQGLLEDTIGFLLAKSDDSGRSMDAFKKFEIGIRAFSPRIEAIRRDLPPKYDEYVRTLLKCVRDARSKAVEPLFDDTVARPKTGI